MRRTGCRAYRRTSIGFILCVLLVSAGAQEPVRCSAGSPVAENTAEAWLRSGEPRLIAWGACNVRLANDVVLAPDLLAMAREWQPLPKDGRTALNSVQVDQRDAMAEVLDALIGLRAEAPVETVRGLALDFPAQAAILAARMPVGSAQGLMGDWFAAPERKDGGESARLTLQRVAAEWLTLYPAPGFAAALLGGTRVGLTVAVKLAGQNGIGPGWGGGSGGSVFRLPKRADWPPIGSYSVTAGEKNRLPAAALLVNGADPIYVTRTETSTYVGSGFLMLTDRDRERMVAGMIGAGAGPLPWWDESYAPVIWSSDAAYVSAVQALLEKRQIQFRATVAQLQAAGLVSEGEADAAMPRLLVYVLDSRENGATLPQIAAPAPNVSWVRTWTELPHREPEDSNAPPTTAEAPGLRCPRLPSSR